MTREIALERLRGNIVLLTDVEPGWARHTMMIRTAILSIPGKARMALLLSAEQTEQLRKIVHETLTAVATGPRRQSKGRSVERLSDIDLTELSGAELWTWTFQLMEEGLAAADVDGIALAALPNG